MSRPGSKKLLSTSKALVKLQRRNLATLATPSVGGPAQLHQLHPLLLLAGQQPSQPSSASGLSAVGAASASNGAHPGATSSSSGPSKANAAGWGPGLSEGSGQPPTGQLSFFDLLYHPASTAATSASGPSSSVLSSSPPSSSPSSSSTQLLPVAVPSSVRARRESSSSAPKTPSKSNRDPSSLAQQPPSPTQNHALPVVASAGYGHGSPLDLWAAEGPPVAPPPHIRPERAQRLVFETGAFGIPKAASCVSLSATGGAMPSTKGKGRVEPGPDVSDGQPVQVGEDAYFVRASGFVHALGIADGVGGWAKRKDVPNANAGRFSSLLMSHISAEVARSTAAPSQLVSDWAVSRGLEVPGQGDASDLDPVGIMQHGYERCLEQARREGLQGSATALLALLAEDQLRIANLGDCCLTLIRNGEILFRTTEMQHSFNQPFQLGTNSRDSPANDSQFYSIQVETDDIVVLCTDGLTDNIFDEELLEEISSFQRPSVPTSSSESRASSPTSSRPVPAPAAQPPASSASAHSPSGPAPSSPPRPPSSAGRPPSCPPLSPQRISEALCSRAKARSEQARFPQSASASSPSPSPSPAGDQQSSSLPGDLDSAAHVCRDSPFGVKARREGFMYHGGKGDDISVVIAVVGDAAAGP